LREFANQLIETMHAAEGIGLAAQQVGKAALVCVVDIRAAKADFNWNLDGKKPPLDLIMPLTLVNPEVTVMPLAEEAVYEEGCLSFPKIRGDIVRPDTISVKYQDEHGTPHTLACDGLLARCIQHEVDHLNGVLFIDRMTKKVRESVDDDVKALAKRTREAAKTA
jgi:peptide deformylase